MEEVAPDRDLDIHYRSISLKVKNESDQEAYVFTHGLLRVAESVRATAGDGPIKDLYWEYAKRIHHDKNRDFDPAEALADAGLDVAHASAFVDPSWDEAVEDETTAGIAMAGDDIGTPIIALTYPDGWQASIFGPVVTPVPRVVPRSTCGTAWSR